MRIAALDGRGLAQERKVVEAGEDDLQRPYAGWAVDVVGADDLGDDLEGGLLPLPQRLAHFAQHLVDLAPRLGDLRRRVAEGATVTRQDEVGVEGLPLCAGAWER